MKLMLNETGRFSTLWDFDFTVLDLNSSHQGCCFILVLLWPLQRHFLLLLAHRCPYPFNYATEQDNNFLASPKTPGGGPRLSKVIRVTIVPFLQQGQRRCMLWGSVVVDFKSF
jgi:hypothetical protein